jgi:hypothetical protein
LQPTGWPFLSPLGDCHAPRFDAPTAGPRRRARLRDPGLQRQQPRAGAGGDDAADEVGAPVILQASAGARKYAGEPFIKHLIQAALEQWPHIPLVMHQDHGQSPAVCQGAIDLGFSSVMMDGSLEADGKTIASYEYNVEVTRKVVEMAHMRWA